MSRYSEQYDEVRARYEGLFQRAMDHLPHELWFELDTVLGELLEATRLATLNHLVIGYADDGESAIIGAVSTARSEKVDVDQCDHREIARIANVFGGSQGEAFRTFARSRLEADLGNDVDAARLEAEAMQQVGA